MAAGSLAVLNDGTIPPASAWNSGVFAVINNDADFNFTFDKVYRFAKVKLDYQNENNASNFGTLEVFKSEDGTNWESFKAGITTTNGSNQSPLSMEIDLEGLSTKYVKIQMFQSPGNWWGPIMGEITFEAHTGPDIAPGVTRLWGNKSKGYSYTIPADGATLFASDNLPGWISLNTATGELTGTAPASLPAVYFTPDVAPDLELWLDADVFTEAAGTAITSWADKSGNDRHLGNVNGAPSVEAGPNSHKVVKFDAGQTLATKPFGGNVFLTNDSAKVVQKIDGQYDLASTVSSQQFNIITLRLAAGNQGFWVNGTFIAGDVNATAADLLSKIGNGFIGEFAEIVGYTNALPNLTRVKIEGYLASKWGLLGLLPGDHPHKVARPTFGGAQTILFQPLPDKTPESAPFTLSAEASSGLPVTFASSNTSVASVSGNVVTVHAEGTINITATQGGDANWFAATPAVQQLKVTAVPRSDQTITFDPLPNKQIGDADFNLTGSTNSGLTISYESSNTAVATVSGNTVSVVGQGVTTIRASQGGNPQWNPAQIVEQDLTVTKRDQAITFNPLPNLNLSSGVYILSASTDSGLATAFSIDDTNIATIQGNTLTLKEGGTANITATQGGDSTYNPATAVTQTVTVIDDTLQPQTITFTQDLTGKTFGDPDFALTASVDSGLTLIYSSSNSSIASIAGSTVTINGAGTVTITVSQPGNDDWQAATSTKQLVVAKADQTITFPAIVDKAVGDLDFQAGGSTNSGLDITYASSDNNVATVSGSKISLTGQGSVTITASQAGNANYNAASDVTRTFNVTLSNMFADSYPGLRLWLDANDINADGNADVIADFLGGGKINTWKDKSGNGDATQADISKMPVFTANAQNGRPVVQFNGSFLNIPNLAIEGDKDRTIFVVGKSSQGPFLAMGKDQDGQRMIIGRDTTSNKLMVDLMGSGGTFVTAGAVENMSISRAMLEGNKIGDFLFAVDGTEYDAFGQFVVDTRELGSNKIGGTLDGLGGLTGEIAELLVFDSALTRRMSKKIEGYLALKWGLRDNLPGNHPYKSNNATFGGNQNITFPDVGNQVVSTGTVELGAFANSGLPITYTSSDDTIVSVSGRIATIHKDGTVTITATQTGDIRYTAAADKTSTFTVSKEDQTITFTRPPDMNKYDADIQLIASSSAGLPITFTINSGPAEILNGTTDVLHIINDTAGFVNITASQAGNVAYNAATSVTHTFEINNKEPQSITFVEKGQPGSPLRDIVLGPRPFMIPLEGITGGDSGNPVQVTVTGGTAASGVRTKVITKPNGKKFLRVLSTSSGTVQLTATQNGGLNGGSDYNPATPITREFELKAPTLANFKAAMLNHPKYTPLYNRFSSKRIGKINPATGFNWTPTEIQNAFLANDGDPEGDGVSTLLEYAWGGDPLGFDTDERKNKPRKKPLKRGGGNENFQLAFVRRSSATDPNLNYSVEISTDMVSCSSSGVTQVSSRSIDGGMEFVVYKIDRGFTEDRNQFMRVNVTSSE